MSRVIVSAFDAGRVKIAIVTVYVAGPLDRSLETRKETVARVHRNRNVIERRLGTCEEPNLGFAFATLLMFLLFRRAGAVAGGRTA